MKPADESKEAVKDKIDEEWAILRPRYQHDWLACISMSPTGLVRAVRAAGNSGQVLLGAQGGCTHTRVRAQHESGGRAHLGGGRLQRPD